MATEPKPADTKASEPAKQPVSPVTPVSPVQPAAPKAAKLSPEEQAERDRKRDLDADVRAEADRKAAADAEAEAWARATARERERQDALIKQQLEERGKRIDRENAEAEKARQKAPQADHTIGSQIHLAPDSVAARAARGAMGRTMRENTAAQEADALEKP